jgi:hypothetical protein
MIVISSRNGFLPQVLMMSERDTLGNSFDKFMEISVTPLRNGILIISRTDLPNWIVSHAMAFPTMEKVYVSRISHVYFLG